MLLPVLAAASLYASRVLGEGGALVGSSAMESKDHADADLRLVDDHSHAHLTMCALGLGAVYPYRLGVVDRDDEFDRARSCC